MKRILLFLFVSTFLIFSNCHSQIPKGIYSIAGLWEMKSENSIMFEYWEISPDSSLQGKDFFINPNNDTVVIESIKIMCEDSNVYFVVSVPDQDEGKSVYFKMTEWTRNVFVFENKENIFPQVIRYYIKTDDLYSVILEGPDKDNKIRSIESKFTRK